LDGEEIASLTLAVEGIATGIFRQSTVAALAPIRVGGVGLRIARTLERWLSRNDRLWNAEPDLATAMHRFRP
jgi:hypothetical protein